MEKEIAGRDFIFSETVMLALSILTIPIALIEISIHLESSQLFVLEAIDWGVISVYTTEYLMKFYLAYSRLAYVKNRWNLLNLTIILLAFVGLFTSLSLVFLSPILRTFRITRILRTARVPLDAARTGNETRSSNRESSPRPQG